MKLIANRSQYQYCLAIFLFALLAIATKPQLVNFAQAKAQSESQEKLQKQNQNEPNKSNSNNKQNERINLIEADENGLYLVGLFDVHHSNPRVPFKCGSIDVDAGEWQSRRPMQNMEAFLWAIEQVNADSSLLPGVRLGSLVMDTCSSFLRTNQQMANLLHGHPEQIGPLAPGVRQIAAIVADNSDVLSVEAVASMASALGITTFVTQSRSTKLGELARRYRQSQLRQPQLEAKPVADGSKLFGENLELERRSAGEQQFEGLLGELLAGVGKMTTPGPLDAVNRSVAGAEAVLSPGVDPPEQLLMVRMLLGNELIADAIAALVQQMGWDFVSIIYDDELDMIDLHDELVRQLFVRNTQLALDEQVALGSSTEVYDKLLQSLAKKATLGARCVITLLGTGSSRALLDSLRHLRRSQTNREQVSEVNSLLWITITDREPYYSFATDALGTIAISSSVSLLADFKGHYDKLENVVERRSKTNSSSSNKWWPEYIKSVLQRHQKDIELVSNECAKWQEPKASPLNERCRALTLQSLVQVERQLNGIGSAGNSAKSTSANTNRSRPAPIKSQGARLAKYLAGGWEHNGMDVINSVLAVANGLESIRQALCPESQVGLCERMRELIGKTQSTLPGHQAQSDQQSTATSSNFESLPSSSTSQQLPLLSELMYNELLRSTFQLADGRMFNLDDFNAFGATTNINVGQLEGKLKLYNLRYLQANSIGFVKFGTYDQHDGLVLNGSKAMHYPNGTYLSQVPIEQVKSSCQDESKCLMLSSYEMMSSMNKQAISEEELALGVNSLFKLDHPMMTMMMMSPQTTETSATLAKQQPGNNNNNNNVVGSTGKRLHKTEPKRQTIDDSHTIQTMRSQVGLSLLNQTSTDTQQQHQLELRRRTFNTIVLLPLHKGYHHHQSSARACSEQLDIKRSFQYLAALAYAQTLANGQHKAALETAPQATKIELTTTVIDYCDQLEWAKTKLAAKLSESQQEVGEQQVAVIDFDAQLGEQVSELTNEKQLLHLTISVPSSSSANLAAKITPVTTTTQDKSKVQQSPADGQQTLAGDRQQQQESQQLRVSLLPSKSNEIQAIVDLMSRMQWKLVHLIYTDHHHYRDEFVRKANEANICVSKLIWIPSADDPAHLAANDTLNINININITKESQLEKTRRLFARELYDYSDLNSREKSNTQQNSNAPEGLNSTRVLVVLASSSELTNQLIVEAASESMLEDYVWISSHEWLSSVELAAETMNNLKETTKAHLPKHFISSRLETFESVSFRHYFASLSPSIHAPIPTNWFDEFWQQHFRCRLPIAGSASPASVATAPLCESHQHLDLSQIIEDDRVHYTIVAVQALYEALQQSGGNASLALAGHFRRAFERLTSGADTPSAGGKLPYGFNFIHRVLQSDDQSQKRRRQNSRDLAPAAGQLLKVGVWRNGELSLMQTAAEGRGAFARPADSSGDDDTAAKVASSLDRLAAIESRCSLPATCKLCRQQVAQTAAAIKLEEARYGQSELADEPNAISSIWTSVRARKQQQSILDTMANPTLEDTETNRDQSDEEPRRPDESASIERRQRDDIEASASSLFDADTKRQVERQRQSDLQRAYSQSTARWLASPLPVAGGAFRQTSGLLMCALSLLGIVCMLASMTHLYPKMLTDVKKQNQLGGIMKSTSSLPSLHSTAPRNGNSYNQQQQQASLANINDYFLLTGLLMLCSINIAFLLPATTSVCWLRRIGLALSYTLIFSSILVKVLASWRQSSSRRATGGSMMSQSSNQSITQTPTTRAQTVQQVEPLDESVEVTFESLPPPEQGGSGGAGGPVSGQQDGGPSTVSEQLSNAYQTQVGSGTSGKALACDQDACDYGGEPYGFYRRRSGTIALSLGLILSQLALYLLWLLQQPPEPTLYFACWRCASPTRSPTLFHYELLLSLLYPAAILTWAWLLAVRAFRCASGNEERHRQATIAQTTRRQSADWPQLKRRQEELDYELRDAKSLVMATTLLVLVWSLFTLNTISLNQASKQQQQPLAATTSASVSRLEWAHKLAEADLTLVYANLISGATVFAFLFVYRLHLFNYLSLKCCRSSKRLKYNRSKVRSLICTGSNLSVHSYGSHRAVLKFNQRDGSSSTGAMRAATFNGADKWRSSDYYYDHYDDYYDDLDENNAHLNYPAPLPGGGDQQLQAANRANERLRLHQFSSYGTYSSGVGVPGGERYRSSSNPLVSFQSLASSLSAATSGGSRRARRLIGSMSGSTSKQEETPGKRAAPASGRARVLPFFGSASPVANSSSRRANLPANSRILQRRQSAGSVASSNAKLVAGSDTNSVLDAGDEDTISCASSVASSSTSQLHGNDLYPIDCSIQLDLQLPSNLCQEVSQQQQGGRLEAFGRRSLRRSICNAAGKELSSVSEEPVQAAERTSSTGVSGQDGEQAN